MIGFYDTLEKAVRIAQLVIDKSLRWEQTRCKDPCDADELFSRYLRFGEWPSIRPDPELRFCAREYARLRIIEICKVW